MRNYFKVLTAFLLIIVYFRLLNPSFLHFAGDLNYSYTEELNDQIRLPQMWGTRGAEGFGENTAFILWSYPYTFLLSIVAKLIGYNLAIIVFGYAASLVLSIYSVWKLLEYFKISNFARYVSLLVYAINTYIILLLDGGQVSIALAYSLFPLVFLSLLTAKEKKLHSKIISGLLVTALSFLDIRYLFFLFIVALIWFVVVDLKFEVRSNAKNISRWLATGLVVFTIFCLLHAYWIIPSLLTDLPSLPAGYDKESGLSNLSFATFGHALTLLQPHWFKNVFGKTIEVLPFFYLIPIFVFVAPVLVLKNKLVAYWLFIALIGIFFAKGVNPPQGDVFIWLFKSVPGFSFFRDPTKFYVLISLAYTVLIGLLFDKLDKVNKPRLKHTALVAIFAYLLVLSLPVIKGQLTGTFTKNPKEENYKKIANQIQNDSGFGRVLWLPAKPSLGYSTPNHPSVEGSRIFPKRPFATSIVGDYEVFNFIREGEEMGELFDIFGITYIGYPYPDERREELKQDNKDYYHSFVDQMTNLPWVEEKITDSSVTLLKTNSDIKRFFITENALLVIGSDKIYRDFVTSNFLDISKTALFFAEEKPELTNKILNNSSAKVLLYEKLRPDFIASTIPKDYFIFPSEFLGNSPNESGWWKRESGDFLWMRNFLQEKYKTDLTDFDYGGGYAISEGNNRLNIKSEKLKKGNILLLRFMNTKEGGGIRIWESGNELINEFFTNGECFNKIEIKLTGHNDLPDKKFIYECAGFVTAHVGNLQEGGNITIEAIGGVNIVNAVISVPEDVYKRYSSHFLDIELYDLYTASELKNSLKSFNNEPEIIERRLSPTKYNLTIKGLERPAHLVFSEKFDQYWTLKNNKNGDEIVSSPVYSSLNSFFIKEDGEYEVYYTPQKYVPLAFSLSFVSLIFIFSYLAATMRKKGQ